MTPKEQKYDMVIIGGGAAGLSGAVEALSQYPNLKLAVLERQSRVGKKLLATGNGRCNYTNTKIAETSYFGDTERAKPALSRFTPQNNIRFFQKLGIYPRYEEDGRVYPYSNQAAAFVDALRMAIPALSGEIITDSPVTSVKKEKKGFSLSTPKGIITCKRLILASGGPAAPNLGGSRLGLELAASLGHRILEPMPALTGLKTENSLTKALKGIRYTGGLSLYEGAENLRLLTGEVLFTEYGLSGIAAMSLSCSLPTKPNKSLKVKLDLLPELTLNEAVSILKERQKDLFYLSLENFLTGLVNKKIGQLLAKGCLNKPLSTDVSALTPGDLRKLAAALKGLEIPLYGGNGWNQAQVSAGGVDMAQVEPETLASLKCPGLYLAGEILNVYGDCGGYNLQWAWSSGRLAALSAAESLGE
ncbi:MAG: aminoacetone oxidase family FAD-binding enzyme [Bacillota bacterium]|nr:aminoacetone oxidase family FAD-binding enzyme [Bacillota bacterium]